MVAGEVQVREGGVGGVGVEEVSGGGAGADAAVWSGEAFAGEGVEGAREGGGAEVQGGAGGAEVGGVLRGEGEEQSAVVVPEVSEVRVEGAVGWGAVQVRAEEGGVGRRWRRARRGGSGGRVR
ncbi:hypothetical protein DEGR_10200 [Deinococcus grandis]|nr:hypothetical protein DEGR_10200 [Deinococcus grandis]